MCKMVVVLVAVGHLRLKLQSLFVTLLAKIEVVAVLTHPTVLFNSLVAAETLKFLLDWPSIRIKYCFNLVFWTVSPHIV